jgi:predicted aminopeptidase
MTADDTNIFCNKISSPVEDFVLYKREPGFASEGPCTATPTAVSFTAKRKDDTSPNARLLSQAGPLVTGPAFRAARTLLLLGFVPLQGCYVTRAAVEEARILAARRPIAEMIRDRDVTDSVKQKLRLVLAARRFAIDSLGLDAGSSFTTFSDIGRDTLVLVLSAARRDSLAGYTWRYPVVGRLPYRGFFELSDALDARRKLEEKGYDTYLRTSDAFSTLGWFDDPLLSTTLRHDSLDLINTVIHEITHSTYFPKGQAVFNESFASFVGARGAEALFRSRGSLEAAALTDAAWQDQKVLSAFWASLSRSLDSAFAAHPESRESRLHARDTVYAGARRALIDSVGPLLRTIGPWYAERVPLNNAYVLARVVYAKELALFDEIYRAEDRDLRTTISTVLRLAKAKPDDPFGAIRNRLESSRLTR